MAVLTKIWEEKTYDFSPVQKAVLGVILSFIFSTALLAIFLLYLEFTK
ncbi:hypothetical protein [Salinimicrobium soli]